MSPRVAAPSATPSAGPADGPIAVLASLLAQLRDVIALLPVNCYRAQAAARVSGSVGAHVRHALDHVSAFLAALEGDELRYDDRRRGTTVESDPLTGVNEIERLLFRLDAARMAADRLVRLSTRVHPSQPAMTVGTTLGRETVFVIQHTIHHCALIAVLLAWQGVHVPYGFGVAASTMQARRAS